MDLAITRCILRWKARLTGSPGNLISGLHYIQSYITQLVGVEVNVLTGKTDVLLAEAYSDAGQVINRLGYEGQVEGGIVMGMGYALMEEFKVQNGEVRTTNYQTYLIPTAADIPEMKIIPIEVLEETGPYGAKGLGEHTSVAITPALTNAIADAVGVHYQTIGYLERGEYSPSLALALRISRVLDCEVTAVFSLEKFGEVHV